MEIPSGDELVLHALEREYKRLSSIADKAHREYQHFENAGNDLIEVNKEFIALMNSGKTDDTTIAKLQDLKEREEKARKTLAKDYLKLSDKKTKSDLILDRFTVELERFRFRIDIRKSV
jgi:hypothetical protein